MRIILLIFAMLAWNAQALEKQTRRDPMCGIERFNSRIDEACGVGSYREARSADCGVEHYNVRLDMSCPGAHRATAPIPPVAVCTDPPCDWENIPAACEKPEFGVASYRSCRTAANGVETYNSCERSEFGVALYKSCAFYKTASELDAYLDETESSLSVYAPLLPVREADLLAAVREEAAFVCLIHKYQAIPGYEDIVDDLSAKFLIVFGYDAKDSSVACSDDSSSANTAKTVKVTFAAGATVFDCSNFTAQSLSDFAQPEGVTDSAWRRFRRECGLKLSYDALAEWFGQKSSDLAMLESDLVPNQDPVRAARLKSLKSRISEVTDN